MKGRRGSARPAGDVFDLAPAPWFEWRRDSAAD
jgi:hypothetical protein